MDDAVPPAPPAPRSGLLRAIGVLNVLFGGMLLVGGSGLLYVTSSWVLGTTPLRVDPEVAQAFFDDLRRQRIDDLREQERSAGDEAERVRIVKKREEVVASRPRVGREIDFARVEANLTWLLRYLRYDFVSGPILNALLVVSGVGLVLGKDWGRRLALATASLKVVRLVALGAFLVAIVLPRVGATLDLLLETEM